jgi:hypothetical protein
MSGAARHCQASPSAAGTDHHPPPTGNAPLSYGASWPFPVTSWAGVYSGSSRPRWGSDMRPKTVSAWGASSGHLILGYGSLGLRLGLSPSIGRPRTLRPRILRPSPAPRSAWAIAPFTASVAIEPRSLMGPRSEPPAAQIHNASASRTCRRLRSVRPSLDSSIVIVYSVFHRVVFLLAQLWLALNLVPGAGVTHSPCPLAGS